MNKEKDERFYCEDCKNIFYRCECLDNIPIDDGIKELYLVHLNEDLKWPY